MADMSALGILSLLLVGGGAAYYWTRRSRLSGEAPALSSASRGRDRAADTMPPTLRPDSEIPSKMMAKKEALAGKPTPAPKSGAPAASPTAPKSGAPAASPTASSTATATKSGAPAAAPAPTATAPTASAATEAPPAKASGEAAAPQEKASEPATAPVKADAPKEETKRARAVPRLNEDEDDVELTRVGKSQTHAPIRPLVEKVVFDEGADAPPDATSAGIGVIYAVGRTDTGKRRKENQDAYLLLDKESLFIVADGMGGHKGGQVASKLAVETIGSAFESKNFEAAAHENIALEASELARAVQMANTAIFTAAKGKPELEGMGTTVVAARFADNGQRLYVAHVGDSRCYRVRGGVMRQMTSDHTMADYGVTGPEGAHLSRAVGVWPTVPIDVVMAIPEVGDLYLICSDGLTKMVSEGTIATQLMHEEDSKAAVRRLILFANSHGGKDNATVVLLRVVPADWKPPQTSLPPPAT